MYKRELQYYLAWTIDVAMAERSLCNKQTSVFDRTCRPTSISRASIIHLTNIQLI